MIPEIDMYRVANLLVCRYGDGAPILAAMQHDALLERGDLHGVAVWKRVLAAIDVLLVKERPDGQALQ